MNERRKKVKKRFCLALILVLIVALIPATAAPPVTAGGGLSGAIFTTTVNGSRVNANIYETKEDVYLDGGPGPNAPQGAAGLPDGDYYFQVTDPPGKVLLSVDQISSRKIRIENGIIVQVYPAPTQIKYKGKWYGTHLTGTDVDHSALTVQLMPYEDTPNPGGVYKVWITPVSKYSPGSGSFGFIPAWSKTDNFKVKKGKPFTPPILIVKKFHDSNADRIWNVGEEEITGWPIDISDPLTVTNTYYTRVSIQAMPDGTWTVTEATPSDWLQTSIFVDGVAKPLSPTVQVVVAGLSGEVHTVVFGNIQLGNVVVYKWDDSNADGTWNKGELAIQDWKVVLTGTAINGSPVGPLQGTTDASGSYTWSNLLPGNYTVSEVMPSSGDWLATTPTSYNITLSEGGLVNRSFGNIQLGDISAWKWYDRNENGVWNTGEPAISGWLIKLDGLTVNGQEVHLTDYTGANGHLTFDGLLPGNYIISEVMPTGSWTASTPTSYQIVLAENGSMCRQFGNFCYVEGAANFDTKGYWHNKNGLSETTPADLTYLNSLLPWQSPSSYFENGDEPINGYFQDGTPVAAVNGEWGDEIAPAGSALAEQSHFLVDSNAGGDPREQLAEQLDAFIMNALHRLDSVDAVIQLPDSSWMSAADLIAEAIQVWTSGTGSEMTAMQELLNSLNESDAVPYRYVCYNPCPVVYPPQDKEDSRFSQVRIKGLRFFVKRMKPRSLFFLSYLINQ